jgi:DeoR family fructose operon transcriptional repressor
MIPAERKKRIIDRLVEKKTCSMQELAKVAKASRTTLHRDLVALERTGTISRTHGGAVWVDSNRFEPHISYRLKIHKNEKTNIAQKAVQLIRDETTIFIDNSSTCACLAMAIAPRMFRHLVVVTNSVVILDILQDAFNIDIISTGGALQHQWSALTGEDTLNSISKFNFDQVFASCGGISIEKGLTTSFAFISEILRTATKVARETIFLIDNSKFSKTRAFSIIPVSGVTRIITDQKLDPVLAREYRELGVDIL